MSLPNTAMKTALKYCVNDCCTFCGLTGQCFSPVGMGGHCGSWHIFVSCCDGVLPGLFSLSVCLSSRSLGEGLLLPGS